MPDLDGPGLYKALQQHYPPLCRRIVMLTGDTLNAETQTFFAQTGVDRLTKPFTVGGSPSRYSQAPERRLSTVGQARRDSSKGLGRRIRLIRHYCIMLLKKHCGFTEAWQGIFYLRKDPLHTFRFLRHIDNARAALTIPHTPRPQSPLQSPRIASWRAISLSCILPKSGNVIDTAPLSRG